LTIDDLRFEGREGVAGNKGGEGDFQPGKSIGNLILKMIGLQNIHKFTFKELE
jgi:hypothetical protein